ncbi:TPA: hypothetical protein ACGTAC_004679, partial [Escherichia coli]
MTIKNLPADYLLAAQQGDIDKVKTCLALRDPLIISPKRN